MPNKNETEIRCSFCGRTQDEVARLIEGPNVFICDNCIEFCNSLLLDDENLAKSSKKNSAFPPSTSTSSTNLWILGVGMGRIYNF